MAKKKVIEVHICDPHDVTSEMIVWSETPVEKAESDYEKHPKFDKFKGDK